MRQKITRENARENIEANRDTALILNSIGAVITGVTTFCLTCTAVEIAKDSSSQAALDTLNNPVGSGMVAAAGVVSSILAFRLAGRLNRQGDVIETALLVAEMQADAANLPAGQPAASHPEQPSVGTD